MAPCRFGTLLSILAALGIGLGSAAASPGYLHYEIEKRTVGTNPAIIRRQLSFNAPILQSADKNEYLINITVGTPPQRLAVTLDTGSSDLWIPAVSSRPCKRGLCDAGSFDPSKSTTYNVIDQGGFNITYAGPGDTDAGDWVQETVTVGGSASISNTIVGIALDGADNHGVFGTGYNTNEAEPNPSPNGTYPSVVDHMVSDGLLNRKAYSLYLNDVNQTKGTVCFGCVDATKYTGQLVALPLQLGSAGTGPNGRDPTEVNAFYVTLTSVVFTDAVGAVTQLTPATYQQSVLLDSGTTDTLLSSDVFNNFATGMGAVGVGDSIYAVPCSYANSNATLTYTFGGPGGPQVTAPLSQLIGGLAVEPKRFNRPSGGCDLGVTGPIQGQVILGDTFLRNAYVVYDISNNVVAIAQAAGNRAGTSSIQVIPTGTSIPGVSSTAVAQGTQLAGSAATALPSIPIVTGSMVLAGTPTFNLGVAATASNARAPGSGSTSGAGVAVTAAPKAAIGAGLVAAAFML